MAVVYRRICISTNVGVSNLAIEGNSRNTSMLLNGKVNPCWSLWDPILLARNIIMNLDTCKFTHMFKAGNKVANALANLGAFTSKVIIWDDISLIQGMYMTYYQMMKMH